MLLIIGILITVAVVVTASRFRVPGGVNNARLGSMSERWMAEQRVSRRS
jgi:hypothetical protein